MDKNQNYKTKIEDIEEEICHIEEEIMYTIKGGGSISLLTKKIQKLSEEKTYVEQKYLENQIKEIQNIINNKNFSLFDAEEQDYALNKLNKYQDQLSVINEKIEDIKEERVKDYADRKYSLAYQCLELFEEFLIFNKNQTEEEKDKVEAMFANTLRQRDLMSSVKMRVLKTEKDDACNSALRNVADRSIAKEEAIKEAIDFANNNIIEGIVRDNYGKTNSSTN